MLGIKRLYLMRPLDLIDKVLSVTSICFFSSQTSLKWTPSGMSGRVINISWDINLLRNRP